MPPARNDRMVYNVYDVIDAIRNGDSDFEIDSEDTDASDEEECGHARELEKENIKPSDCPSADYVDITPTKPSPSSTQTMPCDRYR